MATQDLINRRDLIGKGLKFPFEVQTRTGGTAPQASSSISDGFDRINQSIQQILGTSIGERMPRRNFGSLANELVFMPNDEILQGMAERYIEDAIEKWEKRIIVNDVITEIDRNRGILFIHITYKVISTQRDGNYVYPLYLDKLRAQK